MNVLRRLVLFRPFDTIPWWFPLAVVILAIGVALAFPVLTRRLANTVDRLLSALSRNTVATALIPGMFAIVSGGVFLAARDFPIPSVQDEFSYLLAADTFAHGRLTNPPHPFWEHFESFYINQQPTYASMYPPGQGLMLAAGQVLFGNPWFGAWLSVVLLCMVAGWSLRGWLPPKWAFAGALMVASIVPFSYWMTSYWGGAVAAIGGALVLGAWPRLKRRPAVREALLFALGTAILANTRMYEGAVLVAIAGTALLISSIRRPVAPVRVYILRVAIPAGIVLLAAASWMMLYFWRVTKDPLLMPYVVNLRTYSTHHLFPWQEDRPQPAYRNDVIRHLYSVRGRRHAGLGAVMERFTSAMELFGGALLILPLGAFWWLARDSKLRELLVATTAVTAAVFVSPWIFAHYLAPLTVGYIALTVHALRYLATLRIRDRRVGWFGAYALLVVWLGTQWKTGVADLFLPHTPRWAAERASVQNQLREDGERNLILVRYDQSHDPNSEWVYNGADLFNPQVLWAREMSPEQDAALIRYYHPQAVWLLEADRRQLSPYSTGAKHR